MSRRPAAPPLPSRRLTVGGRIPGRRRDGVPRAAERRGQEGCEGGRAAVERGGGMMGGRQVGGEKCGVAEPRPGTGPAPVRSDG